MEAKVFLRSGQTIVSNLFIKNFKKLGLTNDEFVLWLQIFMYKEKGQSFVDFQAIAADLEIPVQEVYQLINCLLKKGMLELRSEKDAVGQMRDTFLIEIAYEKLDILLKQTEVEKIEKSEENQRRQLFKLFESEFGRPLSSIEFQRVHQWVEEDGYSIELIGLALKEAVLNQAYNFNYIDRVLLSWGHKNIRTKAQVDAYQLSRKRQDLQKNAQKTQTTAPRDLPKVTLHNWLEEGSND